MPTIEELINPLRHESDAHKLAGQLQAMHNASEDVVLPLRQLSYSASGDGHLRLDPGADPILTSDGVWDQPLNLRHTRNAWQQLSNRLGIPVKYLDRIGSRHPQLTRDTLTALFSEEPDKRATFRLLRGDDGHILRAIVSDKFAGEIDNWSMFDSVIQGLQAADILAGDCHIEADLSPDRFRLRIAVPQIAIAAPDLLADYRTPFSMNPNAPVHARNPGGDAPAPLIWAGLEISNSETGQGTAMIRPRAEVMICRNGLTRDVAFKRTHVGSRQENDGVIEWSSETNEALRQLIRSQTADAVRTFCSTEYLEEMANEMREAKGRPINDIQGSVEVVRKAAELTDDEVGSVLACFTRSGDMTALGMGQAVTAAAQLVEDGDRQAELETKFWSIIANPALV